MDGTDLRKSKFKQAEFINVDLSTAKLTREQIEQSTFINVTMPNGTVLTQSVTASTKGKANKFFSKIF